MDTKYSVLSILQNREGEAVSGSSISTELGVSRMAVSKAVKALLKSGYEISAQTNKGYTLQKDADIFSQSEIKKHYQKTVFFEDTAQSTNFSAKGLAENGASHGTICAAAAQTGGRGRKGKNFYSPPASGLYFSVILRHISLENAGLLTAAAAVACVRTVKKLYGIELSIKWVNDLFYRGKKVGGILTEAVAGFESGETEYAVVGIGINLFEPKGGFPAEIIDTAGYIFEPGEKVSRSKICAYISAELLALCDNDSCFIKEYRNASCIVGKKIHVMRFGIGRKAVATDINDRGHLIVRYDDESSDTLYFGEVNIIKDEDENEKN